MNNINGDVRKQFYQVLYKECMHAVYQPIVSLETGKVIGYEALTRLDIPNSLFNIEQLFELAEKLNVLWELEDKCRKKSLKSARNLQEGQKLFLNVDPMIIRDVKFRGGATAQSLHKYGLTPRDIVFEITERTSIEDLDIFVESIDHYRQQTYQIAIDDFGAGYAGINRVCSLTPEYIKIDMMTVRDIDTDQVKATFVKSLVSFCKQTSIQLIAEGIETEAEMRTLIELGVHLGQGYYLAKPKKEMVSIDPTIERTIISCYGEKNIYEYEPSFWGNISSIAKRKETTPFDTMGYELYEYVRKRHDVTEICVLDEHERACGMLTRAKLLEIYGGRFGYDLNLRKKVVDIMEDTFLIVDALTSIEVVSKMALDRDYEHIYDAVVIAKEEKYLGVVTVKDLLESAINIQVVKATDANPLTKLPGNSAIQLYIERLIVEDTPYAAIYIDIDNFKAYNDAYGFYNGDLMIKTVARCMELVCNNGEFKGHIGGDDFIMIANRWEVEGICNTLVELFTEAIHELYNEKDLLAGRILSKDRKGNMQSFPLATLSIAVLTNREQHMRNLHDYSEELARVKKISKNREGNSIAIA